MGSYPSRASPYAGDRLPPDSPSAAILVYCWAAMKKSKYAAVAEAETSANPAFWVDSSPRPAPSRGSAGRPTVPAERFEARSAGGGGSGRSPDIRHYVVDEEPGNGWLQRIRLGADFGPDLPLE